MNFIRAFLISIIVFVQGGAAAEEAGLTSAYLIGKWSTGGKEACASDQADYVYFRENGMVEGGRGKLGNAVGFWKLEDNTIAVHLLIAPAAEGTPHPFYQKRYHYQYMCPKVLNVTPDSLDYTLDTNVQSGVKQTLTRCQ